MTTPAPTQATPLELPRAALYTAAQSSAHPDSEESVRYESRRVSRELSSVHNFNSRSSPSFGSVRPRNVGSATTSHENLRRHASTVSAVADVPSAGRPNTVQSAGSSLREPRWYTPIVKFWTAHICPVIEEGAFRDHLALERTFLGYLRTSLILLMTGVLIAQLFRLQRVANPDPIFGFYVVGKSLSVTFIGMAIFVVLLGAIRFLRLQKALLRGQALAGGWEVYLIMGSCTLLLVASCAIVLGVTVDKAMKGG